jgi:hypothetical protein
MSECALLTQTDKQLFKRVHALRDEAKKSSGIGLAHDPCGNLAYTMPSRLLASLQKKIGAEGGDDDDDDDDDYDDSSILDLELDPDDIDDSDAGPSWPRTGGTAASILAATQTPASPPVQLSSLSTATTATTATTAPALPPPPSLAAPVSSLSTATKLAPAPAFPPPPALSVPMDVTPSLFPPLGTPAVMSSSSGVTYGDDDDDDDDSDTDVTEDDPDLKPEPPVAAAASAAAAAAAAGPSAEPKAKRKRAPRPLPKVPELKEGIERIDQLIDVSPPLEPINYTGISPSGNVLDGAPPSVVLHVLTRAHPFSHRRLMINERARQVMTAAALAQLAGDASPSEFYEGAVNAMLASVRYRSVGMYILQQRAKLRRSFVGAFGGPDSPGVSVSVAFFAREARADANPPTTRQLDKVAPELYKPTKSEAMLLPRDGTWSTSARNAEAFAQHPLTMAATGLVAAALNDMRDSISAVKIKMIATDTKDNRDNRALEAALKFTALANLAERLISAGSVGSSGKQFLALDDQFKLASGQTYGSMAYAQVGSYRDIIGYYAMQAFDEANRAAKLVVQSMPPAAADAATLKMQKKQRKTAATADALYTDYARALGTRTAGGRLVAVQLLLQAEAKLKKKKKNKGRRVGQMLRCFLLMQYSEWLDTFIADGTARWIEYFSAPQRSQLGAPQRAQQGRKKGKIIDDEDDDEGSRVLDVGADPEKRGKKRGTEEPDIDIEQAEGERPDLMAGQPIGNIFALARTTTQAGGFDLITYSEQFRLMLSDYTEIARTTAIGEKGSHGAALYLISQLGKAIDAMTTRPQDSFGMQAFLTGFGLRLAQLLEPMTEAEQVARGPFEQLWAQRAASPGQNRALLSYALQCVSYGVGPLQKPHAWIEGVRKSISIPFNGKVQAAEFYVRSNLAINTDRVTELSKTFASAVLDSKLKDVGTIDEVALARRIAAANAKVSQTNAEIIRTSASVAEIAGRLPDARSAVTMLGSWAALDRSEAVSAIIAGHLLLNRPWLALGLHPDSSSPLARPVAQPDELFHMMAQLYVFAMRFAFQTEYLDDINNRVFVDVTLDSAARGSGADYLWMQSADDMLQQDPITRLWNEKGTNVFPHQQSVFTRRFHAALAMAIQQAIGDRANTTLAVLRFLETATKRIDSIPDDPERSESFRIFGERKSLRPNELARNTLQLHEIAQRYRSRALTLRTLVLMKFVVDVGKFIGDPSVDGVKFPPHTASVQALDEARAVVNSMQRKFRAGEYNRIRAFVAGAIMSFIDENTKSIVTDVYSAVVWHTTGRRVA